MTAKQAYLAAPFLGVIHLTAIHIRRPLTAQEVTLLMDVSAVLVIALALGAGRIGSPSHSRLRLIASGVAVVFGGLSLAGPGSGVMLLVAVLALGVACGIVAHGVLDGRTAVASAGRAGEVERIRLLHGRSHISCFAGEARRRHLVVEGGVIGYEVCAGVAVAVGDPLAAPAHRSEAIAAFLGLCATRGWAACFYQTDRQFRSEYQAAGLRVVKLGEEAVVDVESFRLETPAAACVRHEIARARRHGLEAVTLPRLGPRDPAWEQLSELSAEWLRGHGGRELGFSLGRFGEVVDRDTLYTLARDQDGHLHAFCSWLRLGSSGLALDMVRRRPGASPGAVDLCVVTAIEHARQLGLGRVSLGLVPLRDALGDADDGRLVAWLRARVYRRGFHGYQYRSLAHFKGRFATRWESRDVALPRGLALPFAVLVLAVLHASGSKGPEAAPASLASARPA